MASSDTSWSIAVRTVGSRHVGHDERDDFTVTVSPDDDLACLHHKIEDVTGLKASQQRLIYRGRLITGAGKDDDSESKVRDVVGLCDGQTIHLVPKKSEEEETDNDRNEQNPSDAGGSSSTAESGASSLLAALLGIGSLEEEEESGASSVRRLRSTRMNRRRPNHRLTESDNVVPDPGPMEPVRQGLMTLHTMLNAEQTEQPWEANRRFYRGQWVDCRDTVNQWLEATIADIARPEDILSEPSRPKTRRWPTQPATDPAVSANDFEGRRRLLLEPDGEDGFCARHNNDGVQLLLIHYNGWPHRWDEWIRSDSERIRPFRTRTRHSSTSGALPTPQSVFDGAPSTNIKEENDEGDRAALLPELNRAVSSVNNILQQVVGNTPEQRPDTSQPNNDLPWLTDADEFPSAWSDNRTELQAEARELRYNRRQLEALAPLLDRLGRALTDAAPHVASFAATLPVGERPSHGPTSDPEADNVVIVGETNEEPPPVEERSSIASAGSGLFSLLSRDSRFRTSAATRNSGSSFYTANDDDSEPILREAAESTDADYVDFVNGMVNTTRGDPRSGGRRGGLDDSLSGLLGAYLALSSLVGEGTSDNENENEGGGLQGLGRLLRERGNNGGGGIDIHIHAIVTGPGIGPGTMAVMGGPLGGPPIETNTGDVPRGLFSGVGRRGVGSGDSARVTAAIPNTDEDDMGIFADLYSENPAPLDPQGNPTTDTNAPAGTHRDDERAGSDGAALNSHVAYGRTRTGPETRSPSRLGSYSSQRNGRSGPSPRRGSAVGRSLRNLLSPRRRSSANDSDSELA